MRRKLESLGITSDLMDDIIHDAALQAASNANNGGMKYQLDFLYQQGYDDDRIWSEIILKYMDVGMTVTVTKPKHNDSPYKQAFTGTIFQIFDDSAAIKDSEGKSWNVLFDEINSFDINSLTARQQ